MYDKNISKSPVKPYKGKDRGWSCVIDSGDKKVVKRVSYAERTDDEACAIEHMWLVQTRALLQKHLRLRKEQRLELWTIKGILSEGQPRENRGG